MTAEEARGIIVQYFIDNFVFDGKLSVSDDESLQGAGVIDSAGVLSLVVFLEEKFEIALGGDDVRPENLDTISNLVAFVMRKRQGA